MTDEVHDNWYEDFFRGLNCELWEKAVSPERTRQEVDFLVDVLNLHHGEHLLDIPCGFGRHAIELDARGFNITGVDISETFITSLKEKIKADNLNIQAIQANMLTMQLDQKFSGALCMGNSFGYFDFNKMKIFIEKISCSLETGARFVINSGMVAESILPNFSKNKSFTVDNITMEITNSYNAEDSCMISHILYTKDGRMEEHSFKHYVFTMGEVKRLMQFCGFRTIAAYNAPSRATYNLGDPHIYMVTEKL